MKKIEISKEIIEPIFLSNHSVNATAKQLGIGWNSCKRILDEYQIPTYHSANQFGQITEVVAFSKINSDTDAYWLGIMYTDGWIRSDRNTIGLGSTDLDLIEKFKDYLHSVNKIGCKKGKELLGKSLPQGRIVRTAKDFYSLEFSSKQTKKNLINLGCIPKKSKIISCPNQGQVPDQYLWAFFRGILDGDGWVRWDDIKHKYYFGFCSASINFITELVKRLHIENYGKIRKKADSGVYEFSISKKSLIAVVLQKTYNNADIYLNRKYNEYLKLLGSSAI